MTMNDVIKIKQINSLVKIAGDFHGKNQIIQNISGLVKIK